MKRKISMFAAMLVLVSILAAGVVRLAGKEDNYIEKEDTVIVTSFFPMYILTQNLVEGAEGVAVVNLTENQTGCLHDYQLTTEDMKKLSNADCFVMNGGGMEGYIENIIESYPNMKVVNASEGIQMLLSTSSHNHDHGKDTNDYDEVDHDYEEAHDHEEVDDHEEEHAHEEADDHEEEHAHEEADDHEEEYAHEEADDHEEEHAHEETHAHDHGEYNAHVWMNMNDYLLQIENVKHALIELDPKHRNLYEKNAREYSRKVKELKKRYEEELTQPLNSDVIIFHDAFAYLADELGLNVVYTINMDSDSALSAGELKEIIKEVNSSKIRVMFTEEQFAKSIASSVQSETDAKVYVIDSLVTGDSTKDAYLTGMEKNLEVLKKALYQ